MPSRVSNDGLDPDTFDTLIAVQTRNMLRLTAKSTQFGHRTFTSWLIESAGTVPIKRRKDYNNNEVDNSQAMDRLMDVRCAHSLHRGSESSIKSNRHSNLEMQFVYFRRGEVAITPLLPPSRQEVCQLNSTC
jgi:hypothetical protein